MQHCDIKHHRESSKKIINMTEDKLDYYKKFLKKSSALYTTHQNIITKNEFAIRQGEKRIMIDIPSTIGQFISNSILYITVSTPLQEQDLQIHNLINKAYFYSKNNELDRLDGIFIDFALKLRGLSYQRIDLASGPGSAGACYAIPLPFDLLSNGNIFPNEACQIYLALNMCVDEIKIKCDHIILDKPHTLIIPPISTDSIVYRIAQFTGEEAVGKCTVQKFRCGFNFPVIQFMMCFMTNDEKLINDPLLVKHIKLTLDNNILYESSGQITLFNSLLEHPELQGVYSLPIVHCSKSLMLSPDLHNDAINLSVINDAVIHIEYDFERLLTYFDSNETYPINMFMYAITYRNFYNII